MQFLVQALGYNNWKGEPMYVITLEDGMWITEPIGKTEFKLIYKKMFEGIAKTITSL